MRQTIPAAILVVTTAVLTVFALEFSGLHPATGSAEDDKPPVGEAEGEIKGDVDCNLGIEAVDALKLLQDIAAIDYTQNEPCTGVGVLIPAGEPIPGPQGPPGPQRPAGSQGPQGPAGVSDFMLVEQDSVSGSNANGAIVLECPGGTRVISGGGFIMGSVAGVPITGSYAFENPMFSGWTVNAREIVSQPNNWSIRGRALCATVTE